MLYLKKFSTLFFQEVVAHYLSNDRQPALSKNNQSSRNPKSQSQDSTTRFQQHIETPVLEIDLDDDDDDDEI